MSHVSSVNNTYRAIYKKIGYFSCCPYTWELADRSQVGDEVWGLFKLILELPIKVMLTPILLPATALTLTLAALSATLVAFTHAFALLGATINDTIDQYALKEPSLEF